MARRPRLISEARTFADKIQSLLNRTVCNGAHVAALLNPYDDDRAVVGTSLDLDALDTKPVQLSIGQRRARLWLNLSYRLYLNSAGYLTVRSSFYGVSTDAEGDKVLFHYDYERDKADDYPEAHLQVTGSNPGLDRLMSVLDRVRPMSKLHFPVGGRRYRPSLEDLLEFLIREKLADCRSGSDHIIQQTRNEFHEIQLCAAIRRNHETAARVLRELRYGVTEPP